MIRATTGGVLRSYRSNLMNSFNTLNKSRDTVLSQRIFNSYAEDPASAAKAFKLRKARMATESQYNVCNDAYRKSQSAWTCLDSIDKLIDTDTGSALTTLKGTTFKMLNDPTGDAREQLTTALDQISETIVQMLNQKYGDNFIFAGADGHNVPFEVRNVDGKNKLFYRGVDVDAAAPNVMKDAQGNPILFDDGNGNKFYLPADTTVLYPDAIAKLDDGTTPITLDENGNYDPNGKNYVVNGYTTISKGTFDDTSPSDPTGPGTSFEGGVMGAVVVDKDGKPLVVGQDDDGNPIYIVKNSVTTATEITDENGDKYYVTDSDYGTITEADYNQACEDAEKLKYLLNEKRFVDIGLGFQENLNGQLIESSGYNDALIGLDFIGYGLDEDGDPRNIYSLVQRMKEIAENADGGDWTEEEYEAFHSLVQKLEKGSSEFKTAYTNMDAGTTKLKNNLELLEENFYNLQEQYADLEDVDMADAITSFIWAQYCYNAALKVGNSILSESLMDYLR